MDAVQELRNPKFRGVKSIANWDCIFRILSRPIATKRLTRPTFSISCTLTFPEAFFFRRTNTLQTHHNPKKNRLSTIAKRINDSIPANQMFYSKQNTTENYTQKSGLGHPNPSKTESQTAENQPQILIEYKNCGTQEGKMNLV